MIKMLVVDNELEICDFLKNFFVEKKFHVNTALSGEDALERIREWEPNILLLDLRMPGMSGLDVLRQARAIREDLKVIMITAVDNQDIMKLARELGASDYITKPFSLDYLETNVLEKINTLAA